MFRPAILSEIDFQNGSVEVHMLPRGKRTVVISVKPYSDMSKPMLYED